MSLPDDQPGGAFSQLTKDKSVESKSNLMKRPGSIVSNAAQSHRSKDQPPKLTGQDKSSVSMDSAYSSSMPGSSVSSGHDQCDACTEAAVKYCFTCMSSYCENHVEDHYRTPELQKHQLQDLQYQAHCEQHHRQLELYCTTDQLPICSLCLLHDHRGHEVIEQNLQAAPILLKEGVPLSIPSPGPIQFTSVQSDSVSLCWAPPEGSPNSNRFKVTWRGGQKQHSITVDDLNLKLTELIPGEKYHIAVSTLGKDGYQSLCMEGSVRTEVPPPENLSVDLKSLSATLTWTKPAGVDQVSYVLQVQRDQKCMNNIHRDSLHYTIPDLQYGEDYTVTVSTVLRKDCQSKPTSRTFTPEIPLPEHLTVNSVTSSSVSLSWKVSPEMEQIPHSFLVSYETERTEPQSFSTRFCSAKITDLKPRTEYTVRVYTEVQHGRKSQSVSVHKRTEGVDPSDMLSALHLEQYRKQKLSLSSVLEISRNTLYDTAHRLDQLPHCFLRRLMMCKLDARKTKCQQLNSNDIMGAPNLSDAINPLDLITALFHCSDNFLQQEMVTKMAMCQFAVPLLLPNCDTGQSTLMLWAMRDIVKEFQLYSPAGDRTFVEGRIVEMAIPMISFVRLGVSGLAKSKTINQLLGNLHEHNTFVHSNMKCGDVPRKISDGLVELSWYLPSGIPNTDIFTQPVAIDNLRGDGRLFKTLISLLCQTSTAIFIFNDDQYRDFTMLTGAENKAELFLVTNSQRETFNRETLRDICKRHNIKDKNLIVNGENDAGLIKKVQHIVSALLKDNPKKTKLKDMAAIACVEGFPVDEDTTDCKDGIQNAEQITDSISDVMKFKKTELPQSTQQDKSLLKGKELKQKQFQMNRSKAVVKWWSMVSHTNQKNVSTS